MRGVYEHPKKPGVWCIHWYDHLHKRHREVVGTYEAAVALYHKRKSESLLMKKVPELVRGREVKFADLAADARAYIELHHRNYDPDMVRLKRIEKQFGARPAGSVRPHEIDAWLGRLRTPQTKPVSAATFNKYKMLIQLCYRIGMQNERVQSNPARLVRRRQESNTRVRWLTADEETKLFEVIDRSWRHKSAATRFALSTGLRRSEQAALVWPDIDWRNRVVTVGRSKHGGSRHVPLNDDAVSILEKAKARLRFAAQSARQIFPQIRKPAQRWILMAAAMAEIPKFTWHDLRHTFASRLVMEGVDLRTVQELMGHKSIITTTRYAHLAPAHQAKAVQKLVNFGKAKT